MAQIAGKVGIKKPSLYNHFESKEMLIKEMYEIIREKSKENISLNNLDYIKDKSANEILKSAVLNYKKMVTDENMVKFYKVIYSERQIKEHGIERIEYDGNDFTLIKEGKDCGPECADKEDAKPAKEVIKDAREKVAENFTDLLD